MSATSTAKELRRRIRAAERQRVKTCELAASRLLAARQRALEAAQAKKQADQEAAEATAAALRLFKDPDLLAELTDRPVDELHRIARPVTAVRAKQVVEDLRAEIDRRAQPKAEEELNSRADNARSPHDDAVA